MKSSLILLSVFVLFSLSSPAHAQSLADNDVTVVQGPRAEKYYQRVLAQDQNAKENASSNCPETTVVSGKASPMGVIDSFDYLGSVGYGNDRPANDDKLNLGDKVPTVCLKKINDDETDYACVIVYKADGLSYFDGTIADVKFPSLDVAAIASCTRK
jgi:hypothetical protein